MHENSSLVNDLFHLIQSFIVCQYIIIVLQG
jgi:hypothetical protein